MTLTDIVTVEIEYYDTSRERIVCADGYSYLGNVKRLASTDTFTGTLLAAFEKVERANERLRYCNGCYYKFKDENINNAFHDWARGLDFSAWLNVVGAACANTD